MRPQRATEQAKEVDLDNKQRIDQNQLNSGNSPNSVVQMQDSTQRWAGPVQKTDWEHQQQKNG
jgi:hypothetical protein